MTSSLNFRVQCFYEEKTKYKFEMAIEDFGETLDFLLFDACFFVKKHF